MSFYCPCRDYLVGGACTGPKCPRLAADCGEDRMKEVNRLRTALEEIIKEVGTSTRANKIASAALLRKP